MCITQYNCKPAYYNNDCLFQIQVLFGGVFLKRFPPKKKKKKCFPGAEKHANFFLFVSFVPSVLHSEQLQKPSVSSRLRGLVRGAGRALPHAAHGDPQHFGAKTPPRRSTFGFFFFFFSFVGFGGFGEKRDFTTWGSVLGKQKFYVFFFGGGSVGWLGFLNVIGPALYTAAQL